MCFSTCCQINSLISYPIKFKGRCEKFVKSRDAQGGITNKQIIERVGNWRMNWGNPNSSIVEISQNTEKSPGDVRRLAVTQTPVKDHQLTLVCKTSKNKNNNNNNNEV